MASPDPNAKTGALRGVSHACAYAGFLLCESVVRVLPLRVVFRLGQAGGLLAWALAPGYRRLARRNLEIALGREMDGAALHALCRRHFVLMGANGLCTLKIPRMTIPQIEAVVEFEGYEHLEAMRASARGFVPALAHLSNWEVLAQLPKVTAGAPQGTTYQSLSNPHIDAHVARLRLKRGYHLFVKHEMFTGMVQFMREGGAVGLMVDQHAGDAGYWTPFFGRLASTTNMAELMARRAGAGIIPMGVITTGVARWRVVVLPEITRDAALHGSAQVSRAVEQLVRRSPADWFWVHNRWKTPTPNFLLPHYKRGVELPADVNTAALQPFEILLRAPNWLGDACMALPAVRAFKYGRPDARVTILTPAKLADFWRAVPEVDVVIAKDDAGGKDGIFAVRRRIRETGVRYDVAVLLVDSPRSALEVTGCGIPRIVGFAGRWRRKLLDQIVPVPKPGPLRHHVHHFLAIAEHCGADITDPRLLAPLRETAVATASDASARPPRLGLCAGAEYGPAKRWSVEKFASTAQSVHAATGAEWTLVGAPSDAALGTQLAALLGAMPHRNLIGQTTLTQLMEELTGLDLLLTNDTGTMHLAAALGVPVVALFGSTEPRWTGPLGGAAAGHTVLRHHVPCSPCFQRECPLKTGRYRCFEALTPELATAAVLQKLNAVSPSPSAS